MVKRNQRNQPRARVRRTVVRTVIRKPKRSRPRRSTIPRGMYTPGQTAAANYIAGLCAGRIMPDPALPCTDCVPFREAIVKWRITPNVDASGKVGVLLNKHLLWCNSGVKFSTSTTGTGFQSPLGIFNTGSTTVPNSTTGISSVSTIDNSSTQYSGRMRFLGAEVTFQNTSTVLNTGGQLFFVHNPEERSDRKSVV